jgi:hypothetical protein
MTPNLNRATVNQQRKVVESSAANVTPSVPEPEESEEILKIPRATLGLDVISAALAAQLATNLLGHILYLKSQVPL